MKTSALRVYKNFSLSFSRSLSLFFSSGKISSHYFAIGSSGSYKFLRRDSTCAASKNDYINSRELYALFDYEYLIKRRYKSAMQKKKKYFCKASLLKKVIFSKKKL